MASSSCIFVIIFERRLKGRVVADRIASPACLSLIADSHRSGGKIAKGTGYRCCLQGWTEVENTGEPTVRQLMRIEIEMLVRGETIWISTSK